MQTDYGEVKQLVEQFTRQLRIYKLDEEEVNNYEKGDGILCWSKCSQETKNRWIKEAIQLLSMGNLAMISDNQELTEVPLKYYKARGIWFGAQRELRDKAGFKKVIPFDPFLRQLQEEMK